jgi:hypothetical protein
VQKLQSSSRSRRQVSIREARRCGAKSGGKQRGQLQQQQVLAVLNGCAGVGWQG